jgi:DNA-binding HxlR family transcriptional regulator
VDNINSSDSYHLSKTLMIIRKKWSIELIRDIFSGKRRFKEFKEGRQGLSNKVLSERLKNMEENGVIEKTVDELKPASTQYYLTPRGKSLNRVIYELVIFSQEKKFFSVNETLALLSKKWNIEIIKDMFYGKNHFNEFKEDRPYLSNKVLSECLRSLENSGIIKKETLNSKPFSTEYHLTGLGKSLNRFIYELVIFNLENFGEMSEEDFTGSKIKADLREILKINYQC